MGGSTWLRVWQKQDGQEHAQAGHAEVFSQDGRVVTQQRKEEQKAARLWKEALWELRV